jgi:hypothetical protein
MASKKRFGAVKEELGEYLHTALRKLCDSTPTSLMWNVINIEVFNPAWDHYLTAAWVELGKIKKKSEIGGALKKAAETLRDFVGEGQLYIHQVMHCGFELFTDDDWESMGSFLE